MGRRLGGARSAYPSIARQGTRARATPSRRAPAGAGWRSGGHLSYLPMPGMNRPLSQTHRRLAAQWHTIRNGALRPNQVTAGSASLVWWRCPRGPDHAWQAAPFSRTGQGRTAGCPFCAGRRVSVTNALATRAPAVARQWHPTRNGRLRPSDLTARSGRYVWWKCPKGPDHEWRAIVGNRTRIGVGCPSCAGRRVSVTNSLARRVPAAAREWQPTRNGRLTPGQVTAGSSRVVWWRCRHDRSHVWLASVNARTKSFPGGCQFCRAGRRRPGSVIRSLAAFPRLAQHWHPIKNGRRRLDQAASGSGEAAWWRCPSNPSEPWQATLATWFQPRGGCPFCVRASIPPARSLAFRYPKLAAEWHPTRNGTLTPEDLAAQSGRKVWWRCRVRPTHVWAAIVANRTPAAPRSTSRGCPFCAYRKRSRDNSLAARRAALAREWHPTANGSLRPEQVGVSSTQRIWWRCARGPDHVWSATVLSRVKGRRLSGCPFCARHRVSVTNSLARLVPAIAAQWHPTRNGPLTPSHVDAHADVRVWWRCSKGSDHVWANTVRSRTRSTSPSGCPCCANKRLSVTNSLATRFPALAREWHPTKNGALTPHHVIAGTSRRVWWRCLRGPDHEWNAEVRARTGPPKQGCPACHGRKASVTNSLASRVPEVTARWHPTKNRLLTPDRVTTGSARVAWWRCAANERHEWPRAIRDMIRFPACPHCRRD